MATYRCRSCGGLFVDPQGGVRFFHTCPEARAVGDPAVLEPILDRRDENIVQDVLTGEVQIRAAGKGREMIAEGDVLTGRDAKGAADLHHAPAIGESPLPEDPPRRPREWVGPPNSR